MTPPPPLPLNGEKFYGSKDVTVLIAMVCWSKYLDCCVEYIRATVDIGTV